VQPQHGLHGLTVVRRPDELQDRDELGRVVVQGADPRPGSLAGSTHLRGGRDPTDQCRRNRHATHSCSSGSSMSAASGASGPSRVSGFGRSAAGTGGADGSRVGDGLGASAVRVAGRSSTSLRCPRRSRSISGSRAVCRSVMAGASSLRAVARATFAGPAQRKSLAGRSAYCSPVPATWPHPRSSPTRGACSGGAPARPRRA
jgi:hypothetical protein